MQSKVNHVVNLAYAALVLFSIVGGVVKPGELPLVILFMTALFWVASRILMNGFVSAIALFKGEDKDE